jgi:hypothetical protein
MLPAATTAHVTGHCTWNPPRRMPWCLSQAVNVAAVARPLITHKRHKSGHSLTDAMGARKLKVAAYNANETRTPYSR